MKTRRCATCRQEKALDAFPENCYARRCRACATPTPCVVCGALSDSRRATCCAPECVYTRMVENARKATEVHSRQARAAARRRTHKRCSLCRKMKRAGKDFSPSRRDPETGEVLRYYAYCKLCANAMERDRYRTSEAAQRIVKARSRRRREEEKARRAVDPEFDAMWREYKATQSRRERARRQQPSPEAKPMVRGGRHLDARPFLEWLETVAERYETEADCWAALRVAERRVGDWRSGAAKSVRFDVVDEACLHEGNTDIGDIYEQFSPYLAEEAVAA